MTAIATTDHMKSSHTRRRNRRIRGIRQPTNLQDATPDINLPLEDLLTPKQLSHVLQLSPSTIGRMTRSGSIPSIKIGPQYRYEHRAVIQALKKKNR